MARKRHEPKEINALIGGTQASSPKEDVDLGHDACLVTLRRAPLERLCHRSSARAERDPFAPLRSGDPSLIRLIPDPRRVSSTPA